MSKTIAGITMVRNAISLDYCIEACVNSLKATTDHVIIVYVESKDGTFELLQELRDAKTTILQCTEEQWQSVQGKEKLSFFQNIGVEYAERMEFDYYFLVQADEVAHEDSIPIIRRAVELKEEAYFISRYNMWGSNTTMLNVPQNRKPCSTVVNRLAKTCYRTVDDGENIASNGACLDFINLIEIFHLGFIRNPAKHIAKIKEIQQNIFLTDYDKRADLKPEFDWKDWGFTYDDLISIPKPLPKYAKNWVK